MVRHQESLRGRSKAGTKINIFNTHISVYPKPLQRQSVPLVVLRTIALQTPVEEGNIIFVEAIALPHGSK